MKSNGRKDFQHTHCFLQSLYALANALLSLCKPWPDQQPGQWMANAKHNSANNASRDELTESNLRTDPCCLGFDAGSECFSLPHLHRGRSIHSRASCMNS